MSLFSSQMHEVVEELDNIKSRLLCKIEDVARCAAENSEKLKRQAEKIDKMLRTEHSDYAEKPGIVFMTIKFNLVKLYAAKLTF